MPAAKGSAPTLLGPKCIMASHALCSEQNLKLLNQPYVRVNAITIGQIRLGIAMNAYNLALLFLRILHNNEFTKTRLNPINCSSLLSARLI